MSISQLVCSPMVLLQQLYNLTWLNMSGIRALFEEAYVYHQVKKKDIWWMLDRLQLVLQSQPFHGEVVQMNRLGFNQ